MLSWFLFTWLLAFGPLALLGPSWQGVCCPAPTWPMAMWASLNGIMDCNHPECWTVPGCNTERKLQTLGLLLALLNPQLPLFQDWLKGNGTLEPEECSSRKRKSSTPPHSPVGASEVLGSAVFHTPLAMEESHSCTLPLTLSHLVEWIHCKNEIYTNTANKHRASACRVIYKVVGICR